MAVRIVVMRVLVIMTVAVLMAAAAGIAMRVVMVMIVPVFRFGSRRAADMDHLVLVMVIMAAAAFRAVFVVFVAMMMLMVMMAVRMMRVVEVGMLMAMVMVVMAVRVMAVFVLVAMIVMSVAMVLAVAVAVRLGGLIGPALGLEGRMDCLDPRAEAACHLFQHGIPGNAHAVREQLSRHMTVAQMPGEPGEVVWVGRDDLRHRLLGGGDGDDAAIVQRQTVAILQAGGVRQIEQEHHVPLPAHGDAAAVAAVMRQHHAIDRSCGLPRAGGKKGASPDHDRLLKDSLSRGDT